MKLQKIYHMKYLTLLLMLCITAPLLSTTYYVDNTAGNDANNGLSSATAWQTVGKVKNTSFLPGDFILFKRGEIWDDSDLACSSSGSSGNYITYGAYGSGARPIITGMREIPSWTNSSNWVNLGNNIWRINCYAERIRRLVIDGVQYLMAKDETPAYLNSSERWFFDGNADHLWIYSVGNPAIAYTSIKGTIPKVTGYTNKKHYIIFEDLDLRGAFDYCVAVTASHDVIIRNCDVGKLSNRAFNIHNSWGNPPVSYNVLIDNCNIDADFTFDIPEMPRYRGSFDGIYVIMGSHDVEIKNCSFKNWGHSAFVIYQNPTKGPIYNVNVHHNYFTTEDLLYGRALGMDASEDNGTSNIEVHHNLVQHQRAPSQMNGEGLHFHHNIIDDTENAAINLVGWPVGHALALQAYSGRVKDNIYEHNTIVNSDLSGIGVHGKSGDDDLLDCIIRNNLIYNGGRNSASEPNVGLRVINTNVSDMSFQNNLIYSPNSDDVIYYDGGIKNITQFNALNGHDGNVIMDNICADPLFMNATNQDYHLSGNSPAIQAGTTSSATADYDGNPMPVHNSYDIGAYEYQQPLAVDLLSWGATLVPNNKVKLAWTTATEVNNDYFVIERSQDAIQYTPVANIKGQGTTSAATTYTHTDEIGSGIYYYRLKSVDMAGKAEYSKIASVNNTQLVVSDFYPNPSQGQCFVEIENKQAITSMQLRVYTTIGKAVTTIDLGARNANEAAVKTIDMTLLEPSTYIADLYINGQFVKRQFLLLQK